MIERTLAIIKPDAWPRHGGAIIAMATEAGLVPVRVAVNGIFYQAQWSAFYYEHHDKPFFKPLVEFMASGPVLVMILEGEGAVARWRALIGPSDSRKARYGDMSDPKNHTVRAVYGASEVPDGDVYPMWRNAVHGSDSPEAAAREIAFFFGGGA